MRGDVDTIKEHLDIAEIISGYVKIEKAGASFKARCPFHNEKTASFFISPARQNFYCFGCGAKGDIFTFVEQMEGLDFREALKLLADKAGVEIKYERSEPKSEKDKVLKVLEEATMFFEKELQANVLAQNYLSSRGLKEETLKSWRIGYAPAPRDGDWRLLYHHLTSLGYEKNLIIRAGLIKTGDASRDSEPYDVFRERLMFPLSDSSGRIIAFSGRALPQRPGESAEIEPKYLNSPDTIVFTKSEVLYGLDKAKDQIRKKNYAVLVEGQIDLVLSHQVGVNNVVAASGTAFTEGHLKRLKNLSSRIILAFDGDSAGEKATERASILGISLGFEVKVALLPSEQDPADLANKDPNTWKDVLREAVPAVEFFFNKVEREEKDPRKLGKQIEKKILPMIKLLGSAIEQSHFISMLAKHTSIKEEALHEDLKRVKKPDIQISRALTDGESSVEVDKKLPRKTHREQIEERLAEIRLWLDELPESSSEKDLLKDEEDELKNTLDGVILRSTLDRLLIELSAAEVKRDKNRIDELTKEIQKIHIEMQSLDEKRKLL